MPHPFRWQPGDGQRHATLQTRPRGGFAENARIAALCGVETTVDDSELAWLWSTCPECDQAAHDIAASR